MKKIKLIILGFSIVSIIILSIRLYLNVVNRSISPNRFIAGIEIGSTGPKGIIIEKTQKEEYSIIENLPKVNEMNYLMDNKVDEDEIEYLLTQIKSQLDSIKNQDSLRIDAVCAVFSVGYKDVPGALDFQKKLQEEFPEIVIDRLDQELEARSNFLTMKSKIGVAPNKILLIDIGGSSTIFATYDYPDIDLTFPQSLRYGANTIIPKLKEQGINTLKTKTDRERKALKTSIGRFVETELIDKLKHVGFQKREVIVLMGGLPWKISNLLNKKAENNLVDIEEADLDRIENIIINDPQKINETKPNSINEESLFVSIQYLRKIFEELPNVKSMYFFERKTWLPGYILSTGL